MKNNQALKYLAFAVLFYGLFFGGELLLEHLRKAYSVTYEGIYLIMGVMIFVPLLIGLLLGIEKSLLAVSKQKGFWKVNWHRLLILGVPALLIIANFVLSFLGICNLIYKFCSWPIFIKTEIIMPSSLIMGYVLGSSFVRETSDNS